MHKVVDGTQISFYDADNKIMYIDYSNDECYWYFANSDIITITKETDLFELLNNFLQQQYTFSDSEILRSYKNDNKLVWYSDCSYYPDDEWSRDSVSYLTIEHSGNHITLQCTKPIDEIIERNDKSHVIAFSPFGNGRYTKNIESGSTLQSDFVTMVYQELLEKEKIKELQGQLSQ